MYIFLKIAMLILQYKFQRMRNEHNCRSVQPSFRGLEERRRGTDFNLSELDELLAPLRSRLGNSSHGLNEFNARNLAERPSDEQRHDDYSKSEEKEQIGEYVEKIYGCLNKLQDIIKSHRSRSIPQERKDSEDPSEKQVLCPPEPQILKIKPNLKPGVDTKEIVDLRDNQPEEELQSGITFEHLFNPLSSMLKKPINRLNDDPSPDIQEVPSGQQQRPMKAVEPSQKEVERVISLSEGISNSPPVEVSQIAAPKKKKKIRKSMRILTKNEKRAIVLDDQGSVKNERAAFQITESKQGRNVNETSQSEEEEPQLFGSDERESQRAVLESEPMEIQVQGQFRHERPLPQEESDSEPDALPVEQNQIIQISSRQASELIVPNGSERRQTPRDQRITEEFESVVKIVSSRLLYDNKIYKWQLGPQRFWKTLSEALGSNFEIFIKQSKKYKAKFLKYLPQDVKYKKENIFKVEQFHGEGINRDLKMERIDEERIKRKRKEFASLKKLFNKVQLAKVTEYEKRLQERSESSDEEESKFTEYEPEEKVVDEIIADLVAKTNERMRSKKAKSMLMKASEGNRGEEKAENELVVFQLSEAIDNFNYVENMKRIFELNKKVLSLSCLNTLRSNNLKVINKPTFEAEMKRLKLMEEAIILPDDGIDDLDSDSGDLKVQSLRGNKKRNV